MSSGNQMGDIGARMLSKALVMNKRLEAIYWDRNNTSPQGFGDVAAALQKLVIHWRRSFSLIDSIGY